MFGLTPWERHSQPTSPIPQINRNSHTSVIGAPTCQEATQLDLKSLVRTVFLLPASCLPRPDTVLPMRSLLISLSVEALGVKALDLVLEIFT